MRRTRRFMFMISAMILASTLACATTRTAKQQWQDSNITATLGNRYAVDMDIDRYRIDIDTINGVVTLRGVVPDAGQANKAERIARWTEGVVRVDNRLEVDPNARPAADRFEDAWITLMVGNKLNMEPKVVARNVDVDVRDGVVTLSGIVENERAWLAAHEAAASVDGVTRVINDLQVAG